MKYVRLLIKAKRTKRDDIGHRLNIKHRSEDGSSSAVNKIYFFLKLLR